MRLVNTVKSGRRIPWLGVLLILAIALAVVAFGVFKRKGARKPPPIPEDAAGQRLHPPVNDSAAGPRKRAV